MAVVIPVPVPYEVDDTDAVRERVGDKDILEEVATVAVRLPATVLLIEKVEEEETVAVHVAVVEKETVALAV